MIHASTHTHTSAAAASAISCGVGGWKGGAAFLGGARNGISDGAGTCFAGVAGIAAGTAATLPSAANGEGNALSGNGFQASASDSSVAVGR